ncbi:hypothetical protein VZT92_010519 [Zoarces viviparus]|uniref:Serpin domain-containing protein n=1 Tax=Zoarces viviparus TaxID=48416 RepID=A0AAW1F8X5_ZOAVI
MDFHVDKTTKVQVDIMMRLGYYNTYWDVDNHTTVILLTYYGNTSLMVVLPDEGIGGLHQQGLHQALA